MPAPETRRRARLRPRRLRCESCLDVLVLRHAWDVMACSCGALLLSGRPTKPAVHWLSRPGGGWTEIDDDLGVLGQSEPGEQDAPVRRLGFPASPTRP